MSARLPDFFIAGAPKSGTTSLWAYLRDHPEIFMPELKEPHFYSSDLPGLREVTDEDAYRRLFAPAPAAARIGEASASYLQSRVAVPHILADAPRARFVVILRNPVEMAPALHAELLYNLTEDVEDFERAWELQEERAAGRRVPGTAREPRMLQYREVCAVGDQLERLYEQVPEERRLVLLMDDLKSDPRDLYLRLLDFLGIEDDGRTEFPKLNASKEVRARWLAVLHRRLPELLGPLYAPLRRAGRALGLSPSEHMERLNVVQRPRSGLGTEMRTRLLETFDPQIRKVEALLGRDLSPWRSPSARGDGRGPSDEGVETGP